MAVTLRPDPSKIRKFFLSKTPSRTIELRSLFPAPPMCLHRYPICFNASSDRSHPFGTSSCCLLKYFLSVCAHSPSKPIFVQLRILSFIPGISILHQPLGKAHSQYNACRCIRPTQFRVAKPGWIGCVLHIPSHRCLPSIQSTSPPGNQCFVQRHDQPGAGDQKRQASVASRRDPLSPSD